MKLTKAKEVAKCTWCDKAINKGQECYYNDLNKNHRCVKCHKEICLIFKPNPNPKPNN